MALRHIIPRMQLVELHDYDGFPPIWRDMLTDYMGAFATWTKLYHPILSPMRNALERMQCHKIVDLASGASGPLLYLKRELKEKHDYDVSLVMTDKYPNVEAFRRASEASEGQIGYLEQSVDALDVPDDIDGFRVMFGAFHHFPPDKARAILRDAMDKGVGIGIFEFTERSFVWLTSIFLTPLLIWLTAPLAYRPFTWRHFLWTYLLPIPLLVCTLDGLFSCLRTYSPHDLEALLEDMDSQGYDWQILRKRGFGGCFVTALIGTPPEVPTPRS